jgi:hypothetical protein
MAQMAQQSQTLSIEVIKKDPELLARLLLQERNVSLIFEKRGDQVRYAFLKTYDEESIRILHEAKAEYEQLNKEDYTREQAVNEFAEAQQEISNAL